MELITLHVYLLKFFVGDFASFLVFLSVYPSVHFEAFFCFRGADEIYDHFQGLQRSATPVTRDVTEESMFDLVPFAGSGRIVADLEDHSCLVGNLLQFP